MKAGKMTKLMGMCCAGVLAGVCIGANAQESELPDLNIEEVTEVADLEDVEMEFIEEEREQVLDLSPETEAVTMLTAARSAMQGSVTAGSEEAAKEETEKETGKEADKEAGNSTEEETTTETKAEEESTTEDTTQELSYEIQDQKLESGKTFEDIVVPEYAVAEDGSEVTGVVCWKEPESGSSMNPATAITGDDGESVTWEWIFVPEEKSENYELPEGEVELTLYAAKQPPKNTVSGSSSGNDTITKIPSIKDALKWMGSGLTGIGSLGNSDDTGLIRPTGDASVTVSHGVIKEPEAPQDQKAEYIAGTDLKKAYESPAGTETYAGKKLSGYSKSDRTGKVNIVQTAQKQLMKDMKGTDAGSHGIKESRTLPDIFAMLRHGLLSLLFSQLWFWR